MKDELIIVANELLRDLEHEQTLGCLNVYVPNPVLKQHIINIITQLIDNTNSIEDIESGIALIKQESYADGYSDAIKDVINVLRTEGVDNTVILAVKELTM